MMQQFTTSLRGFSIIEVMVGVFIFSLGLVAVYALLASSLSVNTNNKNSIIASNLAREQVELYRNIRDTNYKKLQVWNQINPEEIFTSSTALFETTITGTPQYYTIENDFNPSSIFPIKVQNISSWFEEGADKLMGTSMQGYRLCINTEKHYTSDCNPSDTPTIFYRYLSVGPAYDKNNVRLLDTFEIISRVIWNQWWYHDFEIKTLLTDWRRI